MTQITKNFSREELECKCGCGRMEIPITEIMRLQKLRDTLGYPLVITSAYRCPAHNARVSSTGRDGPHTKGAFDVQVFGARALEIVLEAKKLGFTGFGLKQHGPHEKRFVHIDALPNEAGQPRPWTWSYP